MMEHIVNQSTASDLAQEKPRVNR